MRMPRFFTVVHHVVLNGCWQRVPSRCCEQVLDTSSSTPSETMNNTSRGVLDGAPVPFGLRDGADDGHGVMAGNVTEGHRFLAPGPFAVASAAACVRSPNTSDGIKPAATCLAEADRAGYRSAPPVQHVY